MKGQKYERAGINTKTCRGRGW